MMSRQGRGGKRKKTTQNVENVGRGYRRRKKLLLVTNANNEPIEHVLTYHCRRINFFPNFQVVFGYVTNAKNQLLDALKMTQDQIVCQLLLL